MSNIKRDILWRVLLVFGVVTIFGIMIIFNVFVFQVQEGEQWRAQSDSLIIKEQDITPPRGTIYGQHQSLLVTSAPLYEIRFDATIPEQDTFEKYIPIISKKLVQLFNFSKTSQQVEQNIRKARRENNRYFLLAINASFRQQAMVKEWPMFNTGQYRSGLIVESMTRRTYPSNQAGFRTIGYFNEENKGVGLELTYDEHLSGTKGQRLVQKIAGGYKPLNNEKLIEPIQGKDLISTLNIEYLEIAHRALKKALEKHNADHGCVIVIETKTGAIRAMNNLKNHGNGKFSEVYNYAVAESYEPGSIFKVFSAKALLDDKKIKPTDSINIFNGEREFYGRFMKDSDAGKRRKISFEDAVAYSSNVAFSSLIHDNYRSQPAYFIKHLKDLDLHAPTEIEILGEPLPYLNQPGTPKWSNLALPWLSIGYENQHTPLQILTAYNAIINDGVFKKPYLSEAIVYEGKTYQVLKPQTKDKKVCSPETSKLIRQMTTGTIERGTASSIRSEMITMAGKTGTAQIASESGYQLQKQYNASFLGHFPADKPEFSVIVFINKPSAGSIYASEVAAPVFKEVAEKIFVRSSQKEIQKLPQPQAPPLVKTHQSFYEQISQIFNPNAIHKSSSNWVAAQNGKAIDLSVLSQKMPDVRHMGSRDALYLLGNMDLNVKIRGVGKVQEQSPAPGSTIRKKQTVYIRLG
jgi:cell division protein FtsI (penicillin-binding protein 3)